MNKEQEKQTVQILKDFKLDKISMDEAMKKMKRIENDGYIRGVKEGRHPDDYKFSISAPPD